MSKPVPIQRYIVTIGLGLLVAAIICLILGVVSATMTRIDSETRKQMVSEGKKFDEAERLTPAHSAPAKTPTPPTAKDEDAFIAPGATVRLHMEESDSQVFVAADKASYDRMLKLMKVSDTAGLMKLTFASQVYIVKRGTKALIIDVGMFSTEVRIMEGPNKGESGLVKTVWIRKL